LRISGGWIVLEPTNIIGKSPLSQATRDTLSLRGASTPSIPKGYLIHEEATLREFAASAVEEAIRLGAGAASVHVSEQAGTTMQSQDKRIETALRSGSQSLVVRVFLNGRSGSATSGALSEEIIRETAKKAVRIAQLVEVDEAAGPADPEWLDRSAREIPLFAPSELSAKQLGDAANLIEDEFLSIASGGNLRVLECAAASHDMRWAQAISPDFCRSGSASQQARWCSVIAEHDGRMVRDHWSSTDRRTDHLDSPRTIAERAIERVKRKIGARGLTTRTCPVLFDAPMASSLVDDLTGALTGSAQDQKATFLPSALGNRVLASHIDLVEDPLEAFGLASGAHDSEGVGTKLRHVVREGVVEGYFLSSRTARKLGLDPTGNADGCWNLTLSSRLARPSDDLAAMLRHLDHGLWVTEILGGGVNPVTGAYSKAAAGIWVEDGVPQFPVEDITIAADLPILLANIRHVGADVHRSGRTRTGSVLIDTMQIAGR
jgi:PmbA protein